MAETARPLSPHLSVYRWQIQMVTSILHRATGVALVAGTLLVIAGLVTLAWSPTGYERVHAFASSPLGLVLMLGWVWSFWFHFVNGIRHLLQDVGLGFSVPSFVRNSWIATLGSIVLTIATYAWLFVRGGVA